MQWIFIPFLIIFVFFLLSILKKPLKKKKKELHESQSSLNVLPKTQLTELLEKLREVLDGSYREIEPIAAGGMGLIAKAVHSESNRKVAIKTILPGLEENDKAIRLFFTEGLAIKKMNHPNIIRFYEVGQHELLYYVMEYLKGKNLKRVLKRQSRLETEEALRIATMVARGLQHCHDNQVIHRDIKPSNIFLTEDNKVKIIDFGIVKIVSGENDPNQGSTKVGSPDYASPEQIQGQAISGKSDIYSLGVCLFHTLTGELPFKTSNILSKVLEEPRKLKSIIPEINDELDFVVDKCLKTDPKERWTAMELWAKLRKLYDEHKAS